jgi:rubredoxin
MSQEHQYVCIVCGHEHHEQTEGRWEDLPDDFVCPECGCGKADYEQLEA